MMVFMPVVLVLISQFCRHQIGPWNVGAIIAINNYDCSGAFYRHTGNYVWSSKKVHTLFRTAPPPFFFPSTLYMIDRHSPVSLNTPYASSSYLCKNQIREQLYHFHHPVCFYRQLNQARHHVINQNHWRRYPHLWQHLQHGMSLRWYIKDLH